MSKLLCRRITLCFARKQTCIELTWHEAAGQKVDAVLHTHAEC